MRKRLTGVWAILLLGALNSFAQNPPAAAPLPANPGNQAPGASHLAEPERWDWTGSVPSGDRVMVENPFGDVRARFGGYEGKVEIHAVLQNLDPDAAPLKVFADLGPAGLTVRVARTTGAAPPSGTGHRDHVDLVVRVPQGSPLALRTVSGAIEAKGLKGDVTAETENGSISVREVTGRVKTLNRYGETEVVLEAPLPASEQTFESLTGDLSLTLPARADATVVAQTSAWITTDISLDIVRRPREEPSKTATGKVGTGAARLLLKTKRGSVQIFQMDDVGQLEIAPGKPQKQASNSNGE